MEYIVSALDARREELGMSYEILAHRSGVGARTARRVLKGEVNPELLTMNSIAKVLGVEVVIGSKLHLARVEDAAAMRKRQAIAKAKKLVGMVQGNSALEGQAVSKKIAGEMIQRTIVELLSGPEYKLWSA